MSALATSPVCSFYISIPSPSLTIYTARLARTVADMHAVRASRSQMLGIQPADKAPSEGVDRSSGEPLSSVGDHLLIQDQSTGEIAGCCRFQTGLRAALHSGYECANQFDLSPFEAMRSETMEVGPACVCRAHRNSAVCRLLWRGTIFFAQAVGARYLLGTSSLAGADPRAAAATYHSLASRHLAPPNWRTNPQPECACPMDLPEAAPPSVPSYLTGYLRQGAWICGPPALRFADNATEFLTLLDLKRLLGDPALASDVSFPQVDFNKP